MTNQKENVDHVSRGPSYFSNEIVVFCSMWNQSGRFIEVPYVRLGTPFLGAS